MTVEGASWFLTSPDVYSRQQAVEESLQSEVTACAGVTGYASPCPGVAGSCTSGSEVAHAPYAAAWLSGALSIFLMWR